MKSIAITTGDPDGIGYEVTAKAINRLQKTLADTNLIVFRHPHSQAQYLRLIEKSVPTRTITISDDSIRNLMGLKVLKQMQMPGVIDVLTPASPPHCFEFAARGIKLGVFSGVVTAPMSKLAIAESGMADIGHTEILKRVWKVKNLYMGFKGNSFSVVLATGHIPIHAVEESLNYPVFTKAINLAHSWNPYGVRRPSIIVLGLNPHASDGGLIGSFDLSLKRWIARARKQSHQPHIRGPISADSAFNNKPRIIYLAMYHDQGLIPFKLAHGLDEGVHITLGSAHVRTSVDHGTAKNIFGKNIANPNSMCEAISECLRLVRRRKVLSPY